MRSFIVIMFSALFLVGCGDLPNKVKGSSDQVKGVAQNDQVLGEAGTTPSEASPENEGLSLANPSSCGPKWFFTGGQHAVQILLQPGEMAVEETTRLGRFVRTVKIGTVLQAGQKIVARHPSCSLVMMMPTFECQTVSPEDARTERDQLNHQLAEARKELKELQEDKETALRILRMFAPPNSTDVAAFYKWLEEVRDLDEQIMAKQTEVMELSSRVMSIVAGLCQGA